MNERATDITPSSAPRDPHDGTHSAAGPIDVADDKEFLVTPNGERLDLSIVGTMNIDPGKHSPVKNLSRLASLKYAIAGLLYVLRREQSIQFASVVTLLIVGLAAWVRIDLSQWAFITLALGGVWVTECLNTAIEASINLGTSDPHPMAKIGKDVASAATLAAAVVFVIVVGLVLAPRVYAQLAG